MPIWKQHISKGGFPNWYEHSSYAIRSLLFLSLQKQPLLMSPGIICLEAKMLVSQMLGQRRILCLQIERFTESFVCTLFKSPHRGLDFHLLLLRLIVVKEREKVSSNQGPRSNYFSQWEACAWIGFLSAVVSDYCHRAMRKGDLNKPSRRWETTTAPTAR